RLEIEESSRVPYDLFESSMNGVPVPITSYVAPLKSKRDKERLDRKKNWQLTAEEELLIGNDSGTDLLASPEDSKDPNTRDKSKRPRAEDHYDRLERKPDGLSSLRGNAANRTSQYREDEASDSAEDSDLPTEVKGSVDGLKSLLAPDKQAKLFQSDTSRDGFSDIFGLRNEKFDLREQDLLHKAHMDEFG